MDAHGRRILCSRSHKGVILDDIFFISTASRILGMHPQTLRKYDRLGLVSPNRTVGSMRLYSPKQIERLRLIKILVDKKRINLAGVQQLLSIADSVHRLRDIAGLENYSQSNVHRRLLRELDTLEKLVDLT